MYKVAIISCGMITNKAHIPAYRQFCDDFEIIAVSDINEDSARSTAERHSINHWYKDAETMLKAEKPDIVSVCVPNKFHKEYTMLALKYGCHVICEKPLAFNLKDASEMFDYAKKQGKILMAAQSMRFTPDRLAAKRAVDEGRLGDIYYGEISRIRTRGIPTWGTFHIKEISGGGAVIDIGVHMIDALLWLMGNPAPIAVSATACLNHAGEIGDLRESGALSGDVDKMRTFKPEEMNVEDFASGSILFEKGIRVNFKIAWAANTKESSDIMLLGKKGGIDLPECNLCKGKEKEELECEHNRFQNFDFPGHCYLIENLRDTLNGKAELIVKPEETINTAKILEGIYRSAEEGREVYIND